MSAPLTFAAAAVAVTTRLEVGQEIMLAPLYDPVHLAEEAATIDQISGGRLILGVGTGWRREEFDVFAPSWDTRAHQLSECVRVCGVRSVTSPSLSRASSTRIRICTSHPSRCSGRVSRYSWARIRIRASGELRDWATAISFRSRGTKKPIGGRSWR